jgi:hypothetical protein
MSTPDLPNANKWQPRAAATETLQEAFLKRCLAVENLIRLRVQAEQEMNIDNFDSGLGVEDVIRDEMRKILPARYAIEHGVLIDRNGKTGGDYDLLIFNESWFPRIKAGATESSRRSYYPIEGTYAVGEIKQTLNYSTFDAALQKLIVAHRLHRPPTLANRLVENRESVSCSHGLSNPLYSFILAVQLAKGLTFEELINRFYDVNKQVKRLEVVRALCVLGHGTVVWGFNDRERGGITPALFMLDDLYEPIVPAYFSAEDVGSALFALIANLMLHLYHCVLAPEDIAVLYGPSARDIKAPKSEEVALQPDPERIRSLSIICNDKHSR